MLAVFVAVIFVGTAILVVVLIAQSRKERGVAKNAVLDGLLASIRNRNLDISDLARYSKESGLSLQEIKEVAICAYSRYFRYALDNPDVQHEITEIASKLRLTAGDRDDAEAPIRMERYLHTWEKIAGNTLPNFSALQSFSKYQLKIGITDRLAARAFASRAVPLFRAAFRASLEPTPKVSSEYLTNLRAVLGLDELAALQAVKPDAVNHVAAHCDTMLSSNKATVSDRDALLKLMRQLNIDTSDLPDRWEKLERTILLQSLRDGALPKLLVRIALRAGENCHYHDSCDFSWKSPRGEWRTASGDLFVSNQRLIVASNEPGKSFEMKLSNIVDVLLAADGVQI